MKIALVSTSNNFAENVPIGLLSVASFLKQRHPHHEVTIVDINFEDPLKTIVSSNYDLIGIGCMTSEYEYATTLAQNIKKSSNIPIVVGGVHISTLPESLRGCFDVGVIGEGELTFCELINAYDTDRSLSHENIKSINGLVYRSGGVLIKTPMRNLLDPLDISPKLDYSLVSKKYFKLKPLIIWGELGREAVVLTSRGCPYKCVFCSTTQFWSKIRYFSVDRVIEEIKDLVNNYNVKYVQIGDDLFTVNKRRLKEFANAFQEQSLHKKVKLLCQSRANIIDDEICEILKSMNVEVVGFGFESGNDRVLRYLKCGSVTVQQNKDAILTCVRHGLLPSGGVMFGNPAETVSEMEDTIEFIKYAKDNGIYAILCFVTTAYPSTQIWEIAKARGSVSDNMNFNMLLQLGVNNPPVLDESIDVKEFKRIFKKAAKLQAYFRWRKLRLAFTRNPLGTLLMGVFFFAPIVKRLLFMHQDKRQAYSRGLLSVSD